MMADLGADAGNQGEDKRPEATGDEHLSGFEFRVAARTGLYKTMPAPDRVIQPQQAGCGQKWSIRS